MKKTRCFFKLYSLSADTYKNNFSIHTQKYLNMECLDDKSDQEKRSHIVLSIKGDNLEVSTKVSLDKIKSKNADKLKMANHIENKFIIEGNLQVNRLLSSDIYRSNYNINHKGETFCWRIGDNITDKKEIIKRLLSNSNEHQQKWCNILCSQTLVSGTIDYTNQHHPDAEFVSVGSDFHYCCDLDFIGEAILVNVIFYNKNNKDKIMTLYGKLESVYTEVCIKTSFLITTDDLITLNSKCFGNGYELVLK